jgi:hypothetical protein
MSFRVSDLVAQGIIQGSSAYATIFYDSQDTGYYLDPNSVSNLYNAYIGRVLINWDGTDTWFRMQSGNRMRITTTGGTDFIIPNTGNMTYNGNTVWHAGNDGSGSGLDADLLDGYHVSSLYIKSGDTLTGPMVLNDSAYFRGSSTYGFRFNNNADTLNNMTLTNANGDLYVRGQVYVGGNGSSTGTQVVYNSGTWGINITGSASNASTLNGWAYTSYAYRSGGTGYYQVNDWIQMNGNFGIYWPSYYGLHLYPNQSTYGALQINGSKNGWSGIYFNDSAVTLMMNSNESGHYRDGYGWQYRWYNGGFYITTSAQGGGAEYLALHAGNYNSYSPTLTGGGASGTWGINITGNADTVDGYHASTSNIGNYIVVRDGNGYIFGNYINMTDDGNPGGGTAITSFITKQGDNYYRSVSPTNAMASIRGVASGTWGINISGNAASASYTQLLDDVNNYTWSSSSLPQDFSLGMQLSFVGPNAGEGSWQNYGTVINARTYAGGGGSLQIYVPYGPNNGGPALQVRFGDYSAPTYGNQWTAWKTLLQSDNYNSYAPTLTGSGASGTWGINITGSASIASQVTINYNNDSNSTYQLLWGSGNSVYGTGGVYVNPSTDTIYSYAYRGNGNVAGTGEATYHPVGIYSTGTNWLYGAMYLNGNNIRDIGGLVQNNIMGRPNVQWGAGGSTTGAVVIKFPGGTGNYGMVHAVIDIYEYNGNNVSTVIVGGHNWGSQWYSYGANVVGYTNKQVRVGVKDGQYCIVIGDGSSTWSYGQVVLRKIQNGSYYTGVMDVGAGYTIQIESDTYSWISGDLRTFRSSGNIYMNEALVATQSWVSSQGYVTGGPYLPLAGGTVTGTTNFTGSVNMQATSWFGGYGPGSGPGIALENISTFARFAFWGLDFYDWNHGIQMTIDNGYVSAANSFRAPIFYDSENTAYYVNPAGTSNILATYIDGHYYSTYNSSNIMLRTAANSSDAGIVVQNSGGTFKFQLYGTGTDYGFLNGTWAGWDIRKNNGGPLYLNNQSTYYYDDDVAYVYRVYGTADMRSPIYYDLDNTAYYGDFASTSNINAMQMAGTLSMYGGAYYGTITFGSNSYWRAGISQRDAGNAELRIWAKGGGAGSIYFATGYDGESSSATLPTDGMALKNNNLGLGSWAVNEFPSYKLHIKGTGYATNDFRAPIFYDSNDTTYYLDPNGGSYLRGRIDVTGGHGSSSLRVFLRADENGAATGIVTLQMWASEPGNTWDGAGFGYNVDNGSNVNAPAYHLGRPNANFGQAYMRMFTDGSWNFYNSTSGGTLSHTMTLTSGGVVIAQNQMRAPIFYDSQDTTYYLDPNSLSNLRNVTVNHTYGSSILENGHGLVINGNYTNGQYSHRFRKWDDGGGVPLYMQFTSGTANSWSNLVRFGPWSSDGSYFRVFGSVLADSTITSSSDMRAPIFYDSNDTSFYVDPNAGSALKYLRVNGDWGNSPFGSGHANFTITGTYASIYQTATNGSLGYWLHHIASDGSYYLYGGRGAVNGSSWDWSIRALPNQDGSFVEFRTSARAPIFYDSNDTTYYADFNNTGRSMYTAGYLQSDRMIMKGSSGGGQIYPTIAYGGVSVYGGDSLTNGAWITVTGISYGSSPGAGSAEIIVRSEASSKIAMYSYNGSTYTGRAALWGSNGNFVIGSATTDYGYKLYVDGTIYATGNVIAYSDESVKTNVREIENPLARVLNTRGVIYDRIDNEDKDNIGFIAQELEKEFPELVSTGNNGKKGVMYQNMVAVLIEAMKEQNKEIQKLKMLINGASR